ncbi:MAG: dephospho-CoA kinase [Treponema sp.]|jgi:dephospho-CoA kinase|nr:dephospho-CoA kinase [Treponema sp.]
MFIGLTGTYCAGKNHIAALLEQLGLPVLDVDKLGYAVIEMEKEAITARFGSNIRQSDGTVDRRRLAERVFGRPEELAALEAIVHPAANILTEKWIDGRGMKTCVINAALLHRSSVFKRLDCLILVEAPFLTRLLRARKRDRLSWLALFKRFASQKDFTTQYLAGKADIYRVKNRGFLPAASQRFQAKLERRIDEILIEAGVRCSC